MFEEYCIILLEVNLNLVQKRPNKDVFKVTHCVSLDGQFEVNILYSYEKDTMKLSFQVCRT